VDNAIIKKAWFDAAIDAHKKLGFKPSGAVVTSFDPADEGEDSKGIAVRKGMVYHYVGEIDAKDGNEACDRATEIAINNNSDLFVWDGDGMGALLRRQVSEAFTGIKCDLRMYRGSNAVDDKDALYDGLYMLGSKDQPKTNGETFYNKRAQYYMKLADRFEKTYRAVVKGEYIHPDELISICSNIPLLDKLRSECCRIPRKQNPTGKIQLMSKKEMKDRYDIESPGMADCLAMGEEMPALTTESTPFEFESLWD
jgi:phage terminase large subunit